MRESNENDLDLYFLEEEDKITCWARGKFLKRKGKISHKKSTPEGA